MKRVVFIVSVHCEDTIPQHVLEVLAANVRDRISNEFDPDYVRPGAVDVIVPLSPFETAQRLFEDARTFEAAMTDSTLTPDAQETAALRWCFRSFWDPRDAFEALRDWRDNEGGLHAS